MSTNPSTAQVLAFHPGGLSAVEALTGAGAVQPVVHTTRKAPLPGRSQVRNEALDAVHDVVSAALAGDTELCRLRQYQALTLCAERPHAAWAARQEIVRILGVDIVARHLRGCDRRRRLQREIEDMAARLRDVAAPAVA